MLPNGFDDAPSPPRVSPCGCRRAADGDGLLRIGYAAGSRTHQRDFALCAGRGGGGASRTSPSRLVAFRATTGPGPILDVEEFPALRGLEDQVEWRNLVPLERLPTR